MQQEQFLAELIALRAEVKDLSSKVAAMESENATLSENQLIQLRLIGPLREATRKDPEQASPAIVLNGEKTGSKDCEAQGNPESQWQISDLQEAARGSRSEPFGVHLPCWVFG
jgi:hypothetical protein